MSRFLIGVLIVAVGFGMAFAQFSKPDDAIKYRKSVMFLIAQHFGRMGAMVKGETPYDREIFAHNAVVIETLSGLPWEAFMVPGTDKGNTTLSSAAFKQPAKFTETVEVFEIEITKLVSAAESGDLNVIRSQFGEVAKSCKSCHGEFRTR